MDIKTGEKIRVDITVGLLIFHLTLILIGFLGTEKIGRSFWGFTDNDLQFVIWAIVTLSISLIFIGFGNINPDRFKFLSWIGLISFIVGLISTFIVIIIILNAPEWLIPVT